MLNRILILIFLIAFTSSIFSAIKDSTDQVVNDTLTANFDLSTFYKKATGYDILGEAFVGGAAGVAGSLLSGAALYPLGSSSGGDMSGLQIIPFMYLGYLIGTSMGVYLYAESINPNISWALTTLSGIVGGAGAIWLLSETHHYSEEAAPYLYLALFPLALEILYANLLVKNYIEYIPEVNFNKIKNQNYLYNKSILFKMDFIKINF